MRCAVSHTCAYTRVGTVSLCVCANLGCQVSLKLSSERTAQLIASDGSPVHFVVPCLRGPGLISLRGGPRAPSWVTGVGLPTLVPAHLGGGRLGLLTTFGCVGGPGPHLRLRRTRGWAAGGGSPTSCGPAWFSGGLRPFADRWGRSFGSAIVC